MSWDPKLRAEATVKYLQLASDQALNKSARLRVLEDVCKMWEQHLEPAYHARLRKAAVQVINGYITDKEAWASLS